MWQIYFVVLTSQNPKKNISHINFIINAQCINPYCISKPCGAQPHMPIISACDRIMNNYMQATKPVQMIKDFFY